MISEAHQTLVPQKPKLLDRVRGAIRSRHYSQRTEDAYVAWIKRFIFFHGKRHPAEMGEAEVTRFLSSLAVDFRVSASTQNQALGALLFLYPRVSPLLRDPSARGWVRHPDRPGTARSYGREYNDDLHPCPESGLGGRPKSGGPASASMPPGRYSDLHGPCPAYAARRSR